MSSTSTESGRAYRGPERRRNQVLVTLNSEYHCRDGICLAVRDRDTGEFVTEHPAIGKRVTGGMLFAPEGGITEVSPPDALLKGERLCFSACDGQVEHDVVTSPLSAMGRPPKDVVTRIAKLAVLKAASTSTFPPTQASLHDGRPFAMSTPGHAPCCCKTPASAHAVQSVIALTRSSCSTAAGYVVTRNPGAELRIKGCQ